MRAICARNYGPAGDLELADLAVPEPGRGEYLVRVIAAGVNPVDWKLRSGAFGAGARLLFPWIPGCEVCGTVERCGPGATRFAPGDAVIGIGDPRMGGASAEFALLHDVAAARRPQGLDAASAAGLSVAGLTALQSLRSVANVAPEQHVLINGAAGGVGHLAVQIAKALGARVTAVTSGANAAFVRSLGADEVIDRQARDFRRGPAAYDVIFDAVASTSFTECRRVLARGGTFVTTLARGGGVGLLLAPLLGRRSRFMIVKPDPDGLAWLGDLATAGRLRVVTEERYPLERLADAHVRSESGRVRGKLVIDISNEE